MNVEVVRRIEWGTAIVLSCVVFCLVIIRTEHAGALWRDECGVVQLASMPSSADIVRNFPHEAFPPLFPTTIRLWTQILGQSDAVLRAYGLVVGLSLIAAAWLNARLIGSSVPLLSLGLIGLSSSFLIWGTTIRGYGLGSVLIFASFGLIAAVALRPGWPLAGAAFLVCLASVQCLLQNTVLLLAIALSAMTVCFKRRNWKSGWIILGIGVGCFLSVLPYIGSYTRAREWDMVVKSNAAPPPIWSELGSSFGNVSPVLIWIGHVFLFGLILVACWRLIVIRGKKPFPEWDLVSFAVLVLITGIAGYWGFLRILGYVSQPWYYLALACICVGAIDLLAAMLSHLGWIRFGRLACTIAAIAILTPLNWPKLFERQTNVDLIARELQQKAAQDDLIVVVPWQLGISFNRYYHGNTPWLTLPFIEDHQIHRYDLFKSKMTSSRPISDVIDLTSAALRSGKRVWLVGGIRFPSVDKIPAELPPAPDSRLGWDNLAYMKSWAQQIGVFLQLHAAEGIRIPLPETAPVNPLENVPLVAVRGWKD